MEQTLYQTYIAQIKNITLLTAEQEKELARKIQKGDEAAKQKLVRANLRLVVSAARKYKVANFSFMDLVQEGNLALLAAASKFSANFDTRFSTYAYPCITRYISRYISLKKRTVSVPIRKTELAYMVDCAADELVQKLYREPTDREIALYLNVSEAVVRKARQYDCETFSLDAAVDCDGNTDIVFADMLSDYSFDPAEQTMSAVMRRDYEKLIKRLPSRERSVLLTKYKSFINGEKVTFRQIGRTLGITAETVRQAEKRACEQMRVILKKYQYA